MLEGIKNFLSKLVPSFSRNETPPPTDHDDAGPGPDSKKYISNECRVCGKTIKLKTRDGKQKTIDHALGHINMFYYNCRVHGCVAKYRKCHQIKYHHRKFHNSKKEKSSVCHSMIKVFVPLLKKLRIKNNAPSVHTVHAKNKIKGQTTCLRDE